MPKFILTKKAVRDLSSIWNYTADNWSEKQADLYYFRILKKFEELSNSPEIGRKYEALIDKLWSAQIGKHIIFYRRMHPDQIEIERILHSSMDLVNHLKSD